MIPRSHNSEKGFLEFHQDRMLVELPEDFECIEGHSSWGLVCVFDLCDWHEDRSWDL